jgi:hypothetical protein
MDHSTAANDPTLGSLWDEEALYIENLNLGGAMMYNASEEGQQQMQTAHSPSRDLRELLDIEIDSPSEQNALPDYGDLDDFLYKEQISRAKTSQRACSILLDYDSDRFAEMQSGIHSLPSTSERPTDARSSIPVSFDAFPSWNEFALPSSGMNWMDPSPAPSLAGSMASVRSERGRSQLKDNSKTKLVGESSSFREIVFDSNRNRSSSRASASSRRQPLDDDARQMMRAVKAVGACWRCKVFRKPVRCFTNPSLLCHKDDSSLFTLYSASQKHLVNHAGQPIIRHGRK